MTHTMADTNIEGMNVTVSVGDSQTFDDVSSVLAGLKWQGTDDPVNAVSRDYKTPTSTEAADSDGASTIASEPVSSQSDLRQGVGTTASEGSAEQDTGLMNTLRGIGQNYTEHMVREELGDAGFKEMRDYDFFSMPEDFKTKTHLGVCFIAFVDKSRRNEFYSAFDGQTLRFAAPGTPQLRVCHASPQELVWFRGYAPKADLLTKNVQSVGTAPCNPLGGGDNLQTNISGTSAHMRIRALVTGTPCPGVGGLGVHGKALKEVRFSDERRRPRFCSSCGSPISIEFKFCMHCGSSLVHLRG